METTLNDAPARDAGPSPSTSPPRVEKTRLAPSPTGALHLGNARTFLINWALARRLGWRVILRIEDLDSPRVKPEATAGTIADLEWLGLDWDEGPFEQQADLTPCWDALRSLQLSDRVYPCLCTRKEIEAAQSAPHEEDSQLLGIAPHELRYPGTCRSRSVRAALQDQTLDTDGSAWRLRVPEVEVEVVDRLAGRRVFNPQLEVGDFIVATKRQLPAYQLAVVVDDARQGVTQVVRGDDLLSSAARQRLLYAELGLSPLPDYWHLPLVLGPDGRRLAKRHGDTKLSTFRERGVPAERVVGLLAAWSGMSDGRRGDAAGTDAGAAAPVESLSPMSAPEFAERFWIEALPREPVVCEDAAVRWLEGGVKA